jgi:hypothetical protein
VACVGNGTNGRSEKERMHTWWSPVVGNALVRRVAFPVAVVLSVGGGDPDAV